MLLNFPLVLFE